MATLSLSVPPDTTKDALEKPADMQGFDRELGPVEAVVEVEVEVDAV